MLPLRVWLRKRRLKRALQGYPLYDPPHKVEEQLLSITGHSLASIYSILKQA
jgi:hypothetical protein